MGGYLDLRVFLLLISALSSISSAVYFLFKGRRTPLLYVYIWMHLMMFVWSIGEVFALEAINSGDTQLRWMVLRISFLAIGYTALGWLLLCLFYTENKLVRSKKKTLLLFIPPSLSYLALLTNGYHQQFYTLFEFNQVAYGAFFWFHAFTSYAYCIIGASLLIHSFVKNNGYIKKQSVMLLLAVVVPFMVTVICTLNVNGVGIDITPISFSISLLFFGVAVFKYRFLNLVPLALREIVDHMANAVVVMDCNHRIVDYNSSFAQSFSFYWARTSGYDSQSFVRNLRPNIQKTRQAEKVLSAMEQGDTECVAGEISLMKPEKRCFYVTIQPVYGKKKEVLGRAASFSDISEFKDLLLELNRKNQDLVRMNQQLQAYASAVEELAVTRERNRFAQDVHDTLGHTMTLLLTLLEVSKIACTQNPEVVEGKLDEAIQVTRKGLKEVRRSMSGLSPGKLEEEGLIKALGKLIGDFERSGLHVDLSIEGGCPFEEVKYSDAIYRICQEALTNAIRHGKAQHVTVILRFVEGVLKLFITDDGIGCKEIKKGLGLPGMEQRVQQLQGKIEYGSDGESGFNIYVEIPWEREEEYV